MRRHTGFAALTFWMIFASACSSWHTEPLSPEQLDGRDVTVFASGTETRVRGIRLTDSLITGTAHETGSPVAIATAQVDSVQIQRADAGKTILSVIGIALGVMTFIMLITTPDSM